MDVIMIHAGIKGSQSLLLKGTLWKYLKVLSISITFGESI